MVLITGKKYACETCIKGHRSSACTHTDRPLFEIKKKGRPVTQCEHCRELRKTKQVHVKCLCESKEDGATPKVPKPVGKKKGGNKVPESAAFPHGLPEALEAFVVLHSPEGSSDSDHSGDGCCTCKNGAECHCAIPRKNIPRSRKIVTRAPPLNGERAEFYPSAVTNLATNRTHKTSNVPLSSHILARIAELRPVLPRPMTTSGPLHDPSSGIAHGSGVRHHTHENMFFSPYSRAYGHAHHLSEHISYDRTTRDDRSREAPVVPQPPPPSEVHFPTDVVPPVAPTVWRNSGPFPSLCGCGDICSCPGCVEHDPDAAAARARNPNVFASCTNPGACSSCLDCTILSLPSAVPPDTILSIYGEDETQTQSIDEWIRQVALLPSSAPPQQQPYVPPPSTWDPVPVPRITEPVADAGSDSDCKCPPGSCTCEASYCGFCQGCACEDVDNREQLTFAVSGERGECSSEVEQIGVPPTMAGTNTEYLRLPSNGLPKSGSSSSLSSQSSAAPHGLMGLGRILPQSPAPSLIAPTSNIPSRGSSTIVTPPPLSRTASSNDGAVYAHSNSGSDPSRSEYNISSALYAVSNSDSDHSHEEYEYRQSTGAVYALSNPDSELSHEEFDYDPRFDFPPVVGAASGENLATYATSNPDSERPSLEDLEKFEYDPSLDEMQIY